VKLSDYNVLKIVLLNVIVLKGGLYVDGMY
jgi:hypothetical protein